jgi:hypothetical protein
MKKQKIAVFISGPIRFVDLVRQNLELRLAGVEHDYFYHLWLQDLSNKPREGYQSSATDLLAQKNTKTLLFQQPYSISFYESSIGSQVNTHSSVNAVIGMFLGLAQLCDVFRSLPDRAEYTHILRIRTDCALTGNEFVELLHPSDDTVTISVDPGLPREGWVSDHLLFAPADLFLQVYQQSSIHDLYDAFAKGQRNPEKILRHLLDTRLPDGVRINPAILRYRHYQIVYSPPRPTDQPWIQALIRAQVIPELFLAYAKYRQDEEDNAALGEQERLAPKNDLYRAPWVNWLRSWKRRLWP